MAASIPYPKIWASGEILFASDLNAEFAAVTSITGLTTQQFADASITGGTGAGAKIAQNTVTAANLAIGATGRGLVFANFTPVSLVSSETTILTLPSLTTHGGNVLLVGTAGLYALSPATTFCDVIVRIYRDATPFMIVRQNVGTFGSSFQAPVSTPNALDITPSAAAHVYTMSVQVLSGGTATVNATNPGTFFALELS